MRRRWVIALAGGAAYAALYRWANREPHCPEHIWSPDCPTCEEAPATILPDWAVMAIYYATSPPSVMIDRLAGTEWWEGNLWTWPHCCTQAGCGMHHEEPFCRCLCFWCKTVAGWLGRAEAPEGHEVIGTDPVTEIERGRWK